MDHMKQLAEMDRQAAARMHDEAMNSLVHKYEARIKTITEQHKDGETIERLMKQVCQSKCLRYVSCVRVCVYLYGIPCIAVSVCAAWYELKTMQFIAQTENFQPLVYKDLANARSHTYMHTYIHTYIHVFGLRIDAECSAAYAHA
jgi:hypothetical protein